jgi:hypothetical protein
VRRKLLIVFLSIAITAQTNKDKAGFRTGTAASYPSHQTIGKLSLAAVKYESDDETRSAFGKLNPNEFGVLPVLLILDNAGEQNLLLDQMQVQLQFADRSKVDPTPAEDLPYLISPKKPSTGPTYPNPLPINIKKKNPLSTVELDSRKFAAKNLLPRDAAQGFLYFQTRYKKNAVLYVTGIREAATGKPLFFAEIPLDTPGQ